MKKTIVKDMVTRIENMYPRRGSLLLFWLGQASFVFKTDKGMVVYLDPYLSDSVGRVLGEEWHRTLPVPFEPKDARADVIVMTHDHLDHLDPDTVLPMSNYPGTIFVGPLSCRQHLLEIGIPDSRIVEINRGQTRVVKNIKIKGIHAEHTEDSVGYLFDFDGITVYGSGDNKPNPMLKEYALMRPDIAIICINGKPDNQFRNLDPEEAAILTKIIEPRVVIPMHYGLIPATDNDPQKFIDALNEHHVKCKCVLMEFLGYYTYRKAGYSGEKSIS
jgi:L-ascorbate 6-phosphate lactonase